MSDLTHVNERAMALSLRFPRFDEDSLEGELIRMRFKRAIRRAVRGLDPAMYERAVIRAEQFVAAERRAKEPT